MRPRHRVRDVVGIQGAVGFGLHELAFALERLLTGRLAAVVAWTLPLLLVKEDQALTVAMIGAYVLWRGRRRPGVAFTATGLPLRAAAEFAARCRDYLFPTHPSVSPDPPGTSPIPTAE